MKDKAYDTLVKKQCKNELALEQGHIQPQEHSSVPCSSFLPAAWLPRILWIGPTCVVGGTLATPLLVTEEGVVGFRHRFSDFSLQGDGETHEEAETG